MKSLVLGLLVVTAMSCSMSTTASAQLEGDVAILAPVVKDAIMCGVYSVKDGGGPISTL